MTRVSVYSGALVAFLAGKSTPYYTLICGGAWDCLTIFDMTHTSHTDLDLIQQPLGNSVLPTSIVGYGANSSFFSDYTATAMIIASISIPNWVTYSVTTTAGETLEKHIGLHKSCSSLDDPPCRRFPHKDLCQEGERYFCSMWRTVGFMASFAVIICLAGLVGFGIILKGGKYKRETGWPFVTVMLGLVAVVEFIVISIVVCGTPNDLSPCWLGSVLCKT